MTLTVGSIFGSRSQTRQVRSHLMIPGRQTVTMELWYISERQRGIRAILPLWNEPQGARQPLAGDRTKATGAKASGEHKRKIMRLFWGVAACAQLGTLWAQS